MFTIEVKKREKDEEFSFKDLEMFHQECYGGKIKWIGAALECKRCRGNIPFSGREEKKIVLTAIDGEERRLSDDVRVVQKT
ncbi:hypothetical protein CO010_00955 [Candidatus Shapirobacteria bacterium CG_4_8_14_3_um_filter_39_11]|uniref:Uncharacterized protein n=2 Tax=Candidatus Shapironibacteriota TaxID=1752721 RepID=A0A2M8EV17_9BACT|nr:MAG: hypothetical protein CO053_01840 [Candidatus Shapirobacteria bacterium CG_4_9_14_0_2_um_filter_40_11]PJC77143.1 MAG: hypothetical protein CO010_00955 [Candidatus Shapirobacteria bacterium CG_4_8_14_3_um_filter_39_11]